jgi:hypothetical protein
MTTHASVRHRTAHREGRGRRGLYVLAVTGFTCALTPAVVDAFGDGGGVAIAVLVGLVLGLVGLVCGVVGSLLLDVLLLLSVRVGGVDAAFPTVSRTVDRALPPLAAGVAVAAVCTAVLGSDDAFDSPVPAVAMALAAAAHVGLLFRLLPRLGVVPIGLRATVLALYVAVPTALIALSGAGA